MLAETQQLHQQQQQQQQPWSTVDDRSVPELVSPLTSHPTSGGGSLPPQMSLGHSAATHVAVGGRGHRTMSTGSMNTTTNTSVTSSSLPTMMDTSSNTAALATDDDELMMEEEEEELLTVIERTQDTFAGTIMQLALDPANAEIIAFLPDGKYVCMRTHTFAQQLIPRHFSRQHNVHTWHDFLDVAHDWGFRQVLSSQEQQQEEEGPLQKEAVGTKTASSVHHQDTPDHAAAVNPNDPEEDDERNIQVFRHPLFLRGDWRRCAAIQKYAGQGHERMHQRRRRSSMGTSMSMTSSTTPAASSSTATTTTTNKRQQTHMASSPPSQKRLSLLSGREEDAIGAMEKLCKFKEEQELLERGGQDEQQEYSVDDTLISGRTPSSVRSAPATRRNSMTTRSQTAAANAARHPGHQRRHSSASMSFLDSSTTGITSPILQVTKNPLVEQAVKSATHRIVADAIETLMHDELHTRVTYAKHEEELSRSSLPGVIPLSKQLFQAAKTPPPLLTIDHSTTSAATSAAAAVTSGDEEEDSKLGASVYDTENDGAAEEDAEE